MSNETLIINLSTHLSLYIKQCGNFLQPSKLTQCQINVDNNDDDESATENNREINFSQHALSFKTQGQEHDFKVKIKPTSRTTNITPLISKLTISEWMIDKTQRYEYLAVIYTVTSDVH